MFIKFLIPTSIVILILTILAIALFFKLKNTQKNLGQISSQFQALKFQNSYRFEEDTAFLSYIVGFKCKVYKDLILNPTTELSDTKFLKGEDQESAIKDIVNSVSQSLSDEYIQNLLKYFTVESLATYISELVLNQVTSIITDLNGNKMKNFVRTAIQNGDITFNKKDIE